MGILTPAKRALEIRDPLIETQRFLVWHQLITKNRKGFGLDKHLGRTQSTKRKERMLVAQGIK